MTIANYLFVNSMERETQALARGLRRRDPDLLDRLIEQYQYRLLRYLLYLTGSREAAEDFFQETWVRVIDRGHQYNGRFKFETWLFTIARNLVIDLRAERRRRKGWMRSSNRTKDNRCMNRQPLIACLRLNWLQLMKKATVWRRR